MPAIRSKKNNASKEIAEKQVEKKPAVKKTMEKSAKKSDMTKPAEKESVKKTVKAKAEEKEPVKKAVKAKTTEKEPVKKTDNAKTEEKAPAKKAVKAKSEEKAPVKKTVKEKPAEKEPVKKATKAKAEEKKPEEKEPAKKAAKAKPAEKEPAKKVVKAKPAEKTPVKKAANAKPVEKEPVKKVTKTKPAKKETAKKEAKAEPAQKKVKFAELSSDEDEEDQEEKEIAEAMEEIEEDEEAFRKEILGDLASSSEGEDSSDDEDATETFDADTNVLAVSGKKFEQSKLEAKAAFDRHTLEAKSGNTRGVVYVGRIPRGFYEPQMREYFGQFGTITQLRLSRNVKTGSSKHYAFIEFESADVARIVADTMDNYLLFGHILQCKLIPSERVHPDTFKNASNRLVIKSATKAHRKAHNKNKTDEQKKALISRLLAKEERRRKLIANAGIEYDFPGFAKEYEKVKASA